MNEPWFASATELAQAIRARRLGACEALEMFLSRVAKTPDREAYRYPDGNGWTSLTWRQVAEKVKAIACGLRSLGLGDEERASILSATRFDWILADFGILAAGGATTTIYPSSTTPDCLFILQDSGPRLIFHHPLMCAQHGVDTVAGALRKRREAGGGA